MKKWNSNIAPIPPGKMVRMRFFHNRLAVAGVVIISGIVLFVFLGCLLSPYGEKQVFRTTKTAWKDYAGVTKEEKWNYWIADEKEFPAVAQAQMILAINRGETIFEAEDRKYVLIKEGESIYRICAFRENGTSDDIAIASKYVFYTSGKDTVLSFSFLWNALKGMEQGSESFRTDGNTYKIQKHRTGTLFLLKGIPYAFASDYEIALVNSDTLLELEFVEAISEAIEEEQEVLTLKDTEYVIERKNMEYRIQSNERIQVNNVYEKPSKTHWLGTDGNGMDILTRLMYGGRISLLVGFGVVIPELLIGSIVGSLSGYFGRFIDTIMMRLTDIVFCIPSLPLFIIVGSVLDEQKVNPKLRIFLLCAMLGMLGWAGIARVVRGQILSLREQEFMIAGEALGASAARQIFVHLIPNIVPQLAAMSVVGLSNTILLEATLSFLGMGIKYPYASWGNMMQAVNDSYVLIKFPYVWIPAGFLILLTVLGFHFIGDGLRDALSPK